MIIPKFTTFSIVARDETSGEIAVAGTTNWFAYGKKVPYAQAGVGAIATQASTHIPYAIAGLKLLKEKTAEETLKTIMEEDPDFLGDYQVLLIDAKGNTAGYTGKNTFPYANHITEKGVAFAGNYLANENMLTEMQKYYHDSKEPFALKLIKTLQKGQEAGGDIRGKKSAALKVVKPISSDKPWNDTIYDLQIDDHKTPLIELERQYQVAQSYHFMNIAAESGSPNERRIFLHKAIDVYPENLEAHFWLADAYWEIGEKEKALSVKEDLVTSEGNHWEKLWEIVRQKRLEEKAPAK